ncbi:MAG: hypothetical protein ACOCRK_00860 [bacterium]
MDRIIEKLKEFLENCKEEVDTIDSMTKSNFEEHRKEAEKRLFILAGELQEVSNAIKKNDYEKIIITDKQKRDDV